MIQTGKAETSKLHEEFHLPGGWGQPALPSPAGGSRISPRMFQLPGHISRIFLDSQGLLGNSCPLRRGAGTPLYLLRRRARIVPFAMGKKMRWAKEELPGKELRDLGSSQAVSVCCNYVGCRVEKKNL